MENERKTILLCDDNATILAAGKSIMKDLYRTFPVTSASTMFDLLEHVAPDLILLDIEMPDIDGYEAIQRLKANEKWTSIPVIFLSALADEGNELKGLSLGAIDYVIKPFSAPLLLKRIENHLSVETQRQQLKHFNDHMTELVDEKTKQVNMLHGAILNTVADLVESRDSSTGGHIHRTQKYLELMLRALVAQGVYADEISSWDLESVIKAAQLHDTGKIAISDVILNKPGKLTPEEFEIMKTHVIAGVNAIKRIEEEAGNHSFLEPIPLTVFGRSAP